MSLFRRKKQSGRHERRGLPAAVAGALVIVVIFAAFYAAANRHAIEADLASGHTVDAQFSRQYLVLKDRTEVKVAGVPIGIVTGTHHDAQGMLVSMKIYGHNENVLGTTPKAAIRLNTLLGGIVYIQLYPGGANGHPTATIPMARTTVPVYVDSILSAIPPPAQAGTKQFINQFDATLADGGEKSLSSALATAPGALAPAKGVLQAFQGDQPGDLTDLVANLDATAVTLTRQEGQLESVVDGLGSFSATLGDQAQELAQTVAGLPSDLSQARAGLTALDTTLDEVDITADVARPSIEQLDGLVTEAQPTLVAAAPVLDRLLPLLTEADPLLAQLVPTSTTLTSVLDDVKGPVIDRVLDPLIPDLNKVNHLEDQPASTLYEEIAYAVTNVDGATAYVNGTGHYPPVILGFNAASVVPSSFQLPIDGCGMVGGDAGCPKGVEPPGVRP